MRDVFIWFVGRRIQKLSKQMDFEMELIQYNKILIKEKNTEITVLENRIDDSKKRIKNLEETIKLLSKIKER